jgi:hypothetical protein
MREEEKLRSFVGYKMGGGDREKKSAGLREAEK